MEKLFFNKKTPLNILCLGAHCDDIEIGCGGTLLGLLNKYAVDHIKWVTFSSNEVREKESRESAMFFLQGASTKEIIIKNWKDGFLPFYAIEVKDFFEELKKDFSPDIIFTHYRNDRHQDHRLISDMTWNTWRNHLILEYEIPKYDGDIGNPNFFIPLSEELLRKKTQIILESFKSQNEKHWFDESTFFFLPRFRGMESAEKYSEAFYARKLILS